MGFETAGLTERLRGDRAIESVTFLPSLPRDYDSFNGIASDMSLIPSAFQTTKTTGTFDTIAVTLQL